MFSEIMRLIEGSSATFSLAAGTTVTLSASQTLKPQWQALLTSDSYLVDTASLVTNPATFALGYYRSRVHKVDASGYRRAQPTTSEFIDSLAVGDQPLADAQVNLSVLSTLNKHLRMAPSAAMVGDASSAFGQTSAILQKMGETISTLTEHTSARQKDLDATRTSLAAEAEKSFKVREAELRSKYKTKQDELAERAQAVQDRESMLDDRENTHVRRELQRGMAKLSDTTLSNNLLNQSWRPFLIPIGLVLIGLLGLAALIAGEISNTNALNTSVQSTLKDTLILTSAKPAIIDNLNRTITFSQLRIGLQGLGAAALVWFALRLANARYRQVSRWEQDLHRFRLDTERAGFLIEGDLEARKVSENGLPEVMLERFSRGLFSSNESRADGQDEIGSTLTALLGRATNVKLGPQGAEVSIDKPGLRRARRDLDDAGNDEA